MPVIIDTGFYLALNSVKDPHHKRAVEIGREILAGMHGQPLVSDYVAAEVLNYLTSRHARHEDMRRMAAELFALDGPSWLEMAKVDLETLKASLALFLEFGIGRGLSLTDCSTIALSRMMDRPLLASFDSGFDGVIPRLS